MIKANTCIIEVCQVFSGDFLRGSVRVIRRVPAVLGSARRRTAKKHQERRERSRLPTNEQGLVEWLNSGGSRHEMKIQYPRQVRFRTRDQFGRIAAGLPDGLDLDGQRPEVQRGRSLLP